MDVERAIHDEQKHLLLSTKGSRDEFNEIVEDIIDLQEVTTTFIEIPKRDGYKLEEDKMGMCFIINNVDREQPATRKDVRWCAQVFRNMGFDVKLYLNQTKEEMRSIRHNQILDDANYKDCNCLVILVIAHGSEKRNILATDGTAWNLDILEQQISGIKSLEGKPKLLFVDACRGKQRNLVQKSKVGLENGQNVSTKDVKDKHTEDEDDEEYEEEDDEDLLNPVAVSVKNIGMGNEAMEIDEKKKKGGVQSTNGQSGKMSEDLPTMPAKRDQFIGLSTVENFVALTVQTVGSPYLQNLMRQLGEDCFLSVLQTIHQATRQLVANNPVPKFGYIVADEHNRLHKNLQLSNYLFRERRGSQPLLKGCVSYESRMPLLGVSYNLLDLYPDAHLDLTLESQTKAAVNQAHGNYNYGNNQLLKSFYCLLKDSEVKPVDDPPQAYMEIYKSTSECFRKTTSLLQIRKNGCPVDSAGIHEKLISTKPCPGFNVTEDGIERCTITFHKEFPTAKVSLSQENQEILQCGNVTSINTSMSVFKTWIEKRIEPKDESSKDGDEKEEAYESLLDFWGHHFVTEFYQGGSVTLTLLLTKEDLQNVEEIKEYLNKVCSDEALKDLEPVIRPTAVIDVEFHGGNIEHHRKKLSEINSDQMKEWRKSLLERPAHLVSKVSIQPIHMAVDCLDSEKGKTVRQVSEKLLREGRNWSTIEIQIEDGTATYTGETRNGKAHGRGTIISLQEEYSGDFKEGRKSGHGKGHFYQNMSRYARNLSFYQGEWLDDKPHGNGEGHFNKGDVYIGQWKKGKPEGLGTVYYGDGNETMVICKEGFVDEVVKGEIQDKQVGTGQDDVIVKSSKFIQFINNFKWQIVFITSILLIVIAFLFGEYIGETDSSCTEAMMDNWEHVSRYNWKESGFLDVSVTRLNKINPKACENRNLFIDFFPITAKAKGETIERECASLEIPENNAEFTKTSFVRRLYGKHVLRLRTCDPQKYNCSDIVNSRDIKCRPVKRYKNLSCLQALTNQWDDVTIYNRSDNTLTLDLGLLANTTKDMCKLDETGITLEMFAVSPKAPENRTAYYSCDSYSMDPYVLSFGQSVILNDFGVKIFHYVAGSFVFRLSQGETKACTYPKKVYQSEITDDIVGIWESRECTNNPKENKKVITSAKWVNDSCSLTVPGFPLRDCYLMDPTQKLTAMIKFYIANETENCQDTTDVELLPQKIVNILQRKNAYTVVEDVTFQQSSSFTLCRLEVFLDYHYPLCPSRNVDDQDKCSRIAETPIKVINCEKQI